MADTQTVDTTASGEKLPTVQEFISAVKGQLTEWNQSTVEGLCHSQTQTVIEDLVPYYQTEDEAYMAPDVDTFKQVIRDFQQQKERSNFDELTEPEVSDLVVLLAPHFHASAEETQIEADTNEGNLDTHPF